MYQITSNFIGYLFFNSHDIFSFVTVKYLQTCILLFSCWDSHRDTLKHCKCHFYSQYVIVILEDYYRTNSFFVALSQLWLAESTKQFWPKLLSRLTDLSRTPSLCFSLNYFTWLQTNSGTLPISGSSVSLYLN